MWLEGPQRFWRCNEVTRSSTVAELRAHAAMEAGVDVARVRLLLDGDALHDEATAEGLQLFQRASELVVEVLEP